MLTREVARNLLIVVNSPDTYIALKDYAEERIAALHKQLEIAEGVNISLIQGQIRELRRILSLRDEVIKDAEDGNS